jgi:hypothetical protein
MIQRQGSLTSFYSHLGLAFQSKDDAQKGKPKPSNECDQHKRKIVKKPQRLHLTAYRGKQKDWGTFIGLAKLD